jgi:hypothetical protein
MKTSALHAGGSWARPAIGIVRVSRQNSNEDSRESPEVQRRLITRFAGPQGRGWDLIEILDENELRNGNVSGGRDVFRRRGFRAAIKRTEAGKAIPDLIVVADHGRLFRDIDLQRSAIDRVKGTGGQLPAVSSGRITHETTDASASRAPAWRVYRAMPALAFIIGARRAWTVEMISSEGVPCR